MPPAAKKVPVEVVAKAAALTKQYVIAKPVPVAVKKPAREKVIAALKRLHPMD